MSILDAAGKIAGNSGQFLRHMQYEILKEFSDFLILSKLNEAPFSGYDVISYFRNNYGILLSSGNVYSQLSRMESLGFVKSAWTGKKRIYKLTASGALLLQKFRENIYAIQIFINKLVTNEFRVEVNWNNSNSPKLKLAPIRGKPWFEPKLLSGL